MGLELTVVPSGSTPACLALVPPSVGSRDVPHLLVSQGPPAYFYLGMRHTFPSEPRHKLLPLMVSKNRAGTPCLTLSVFTIRILPAHLRVTPRVCPFPASLVVNRLTLGLVQSLPKLERAMFP